MLGLAVGAHAAAAVPECSSAREAEATSSHVARREGGGEAGGGEEGRGAIAAADSGAAVVHDAAWDGEEVGEEAGEAGAGEVAILEVNTRVGGDLAADV